MQARTVVVHNTGRRMKLIIEPSSSIALAPLLRAEGVRVLNLPTRSDGKPLKIGIIFSGGNVDLL